MTIPELTPELERLAQDARPLSDADWGSARQIDAECAFVDAIGIDNDGGCVLGAEFDEFCLKATTDEWIDEALRLLRRQP